MVLLNDQGIYFNIHLLTYLRDIQGTMDENHTHPIG